MQIGTTVPTSCTEPSLVPRESIAEWSRRAEAAGFAGLWALDHLVVPPTYRTSMLDPLSALGFVAGHTSTVDLGTSILLLPLRRTATVASSAQTINHLTGGRLTLGLGAGYVEKEFEVAGVPIEERGPRLSEAIDVLKVLFAGEASFQGRFHDFDDVRIDPVTDPPPRLLAGGNSNVGDGGRTMPDPMLERILESGGWIAPPSSPAKLEAETEIIDAYARERSVDPATLDRVLLSYTHLVDPDAAADPREEQRTAFEQYFSDRRGFEYAEEHALVGTVDEVLERLERYRAIGFDQVIVGPATSDPAELPVQMDLLSEHVLPEFGE
ncbi:MAG: LLM class flavin-dependent oxidoreductase [Halanaeroarchaeum sp.]